MTKKELVEQLEQYDDDDQLWFFHRLKGGVMPAEITLPIQKTEYTADGILLS